MIDIYYIISGIIIVLSIIVLVTNKNRTWLAMLGMGLVFGILAARSIIITHDDGQFWLNVAVAVSFTASGILRYYKIIR
jgi:uncharacterized membrane protein HdeD (DUF308 family)